MGSITPVTYRNLTFTKTSPNSDNAVTDVLHAPAHLELLVSLGLASQEHSEAALCAIKRLNDQAWADLPDREFTAFYFLKCAILDQIFRRMRREKQQAGTKTKRKKAKANILNQQRNLEADK